MRPFPTPLAPVLSSALLLTSILIIAPALVHATDEAQQTAPDATIRPAPPKPDTVRPAPRPKYADLMPPLDTTDRAATLEAVHLALSELGDGAAYVWHRNGGRLSGIFKPTASFRDRDGRVCRHLVLTLTAGQHTSRTEGIACRMADMSWRLEG